MTREGSASESKQFSDPQLAEVYDSINALGEDRDFWLNEIARLAPSSIIDFGCGTGLLTCELADLGYEVTGVEPARPMLDVAQRKEHAERVRWIEGDYRRLDGLKADLFLMTSHVAQFLIEEDEWNGMLGSAYEALHSGGHILFDSRRTIVGAFEEWPAESSRRRVVDPVAGELEYWCELHDATPPIAEYELHYQFAESGEKVVSTERIIFRPKEEIEQSLKEAGFDVKMVFGDWDHSRFNQSSPEMIFVAQKGELSSRTGSAEQPLRNPPQQLAAD